MAKQAETASKERDGAVGVYASKRPKSPRFVPEAFLESLETSQAPPGALVVIARLLSESERRKMSRQHLEEARREETVFRGGLSLEQSRADVGP